MPLWMHIFSPWAMLLYILECLLVNFGALCLSSACVQRGGALRFAAGRIMPAFVLAMLSRALGYALMLAVSVLSGSVLSDGLLAADYSSFSVLRIPLLACLISAAAMFLLSRYALLRGSGLDARQLAVMSGCFALLNVPYLLLIPVVI